MANSAKLSDGLNKILGLPKGKFIYMAIEVGFDAETVQKVFEILEANPKFSNKTFVTQAQLLQKAIEAGLWEPGTKS